MKPRQPELIGEIPVSETKTLAGSGKLPSFLMFAPACFPPGNPEAFVNANLVMAVLRGGWQVDVVTMATAAHWYPHDPNAWPGLAECSVPVAEGRKTVAGLALAAAKTVIRSGHLVGGGRWALPAAQAALQLAKQRGYDCIISRALPPMAHLAALITARQTGLPWIANWNDPVPAEKFPAPYAGGKGKHAALPFWKNRFYREVGRQADWHTFPSERLRSYITDYLPKGSYQKSSVVPHIALDRGAAPTGARRSNFTLMHAGSLLPPRSPDVFLEGVRLFRDSNQSLRGFCVVFIVDRPDDVRQAAKAHGVEDLVRIEKSRPYSEMPEVLAGADVLVIVEALVEEGIFLPSKFVDYVRTGRPILALSPPVGTLADILGERGGGIAVDGGRADAVARALQGMYRCWLDGTLDRRFGSERLFPHYSSEAILGAYRELIAQIGRKRRG